MELLGHVILLLIFGGTAMLFTTVTATFLSLSNSAQWVRFFHIFANTWHFLGCFFPPLILFLRSSQLMGVR
jgi:hypothetical protein